MTDEFMKLENTIKDAVRSLSENSLNVRNAHPYTKNTSNNDNMIVVQSSSHRPNAHQENDEAYGKFNDSQIAPPDIQ